MLRAAAERGLSFPDYLDQELGTREHTGWIFDQAAEFGIFDSPARHVCEIGTGTGMFTETFRARYQPEVYESYEPDPGWAEWLAEYHGVISQECDGHSLCHTADASVDMVHAHGVFIYLAFLTSVQYFREIARVLRPGGVAFFDIMSEECMTESAVNEWLASEWRFPAVLPRAYVQEVFTRNGCELVGSFVTPFMETRPSHYLIFRKG
jgi:ubiquinone/menaquinone biosynthesis C-methylase UbiE